MTDVTRILNAIRCGNTQATEELLPIVYEELRLLAAQKLSREAPGQTLQATALVHEAYLRLSGSHDQDWQSRGHFFAAAAEAMRRILIDNARRRKSLKRGGAHRRVDLCHAAPAAEVGIVPEELLALDEALGNLARTDAKVADLVKLRFFAGLTAQQAARALGISHNTADAYWAYARAWLRVEMAQGTNGGHA